VRGAGALDDLDVAIGARASRAAAQAVEAHAVDVVPEHMCSFRSEKQRFSTGSGAEIEDRLAGLGADEMAEKLASFVPGLELSLTPGARAEQVRLRGAHEQPIRSAGG